MCRYCTDLNLADPKEAKKNMDILARAIKHSKDPKEQKHLWSVSEKLIDKLVPQNETDKDVESDWHKAMYGED